MRSEATLLLLGVAVLLSACLSQSGVQRTYVRDQEACQGMAEQNIDRYLPKDQAVSVADRNAQMVTLFSDCMGKSGWQVAKPRKAVDAVTAPAPVAPPPPAPQTAPAPAVPPAATTPASSVQAPPDQLVPPSSYEPVYGTGPGRSF